MATDHEEVPAHEPSEPDPASSDRDGIPDDRRYELLDGPQRQALERAQLRWAKDEGEAHRSDQDVWLGRDGTTARCGVPVKKGPWAGQGCKNPAGHNTVHAGYGPCFMHGGAKLKGRAEGAWVAAHAFAQQLNINPWDALLMAVRIAAGKVSYCETVIGTAVSDLELEGRFERVSANEDGTGGILVHPDTGEALGVGQYRDLSFWVKQSELWHDRLAKTSKMAVDAGIAAYEIQKVEAEAQRMARVLNAVIEGLDGKIDERLALEMRALMRSELLRIDQEESANAGMQAIESASVATAQHRESIDGTGSWED